MLALARESGRRINAIVNLRASDVLLSREQIAIALGSLGQPTAWAEHWPYGALRWRSEHDKMGYETVTPLSSRARAALDVYLTRNPRAGEIPLFPELKDDGRCASRDIAEHWLRLAERKARLPRLARRVPCLPPSVRLRAPAPLRRRPHERRGMALADGDAAVLPTRRR